VFESIESSFLQEEMLGLEPEGAGGEQKEKEDCFPEWSCAGVGLYIE
jgi:hypothetical protein